MEVINEFCLKLQWQFGYNSCFIKDHFLVYVRLILGYAIFFFLNGVHDSDDCTLVDKDTLTLQLLLPRFVGQFLCSYSTLPLYALVTQVLHT